MSAIPHPAARVGVRIDPRINAEKLAPRALEDIEVAMTVKNLQLFYGDKQALHDITLNIPRRHVVAFIGPSGCGKSTLLRCFNRMNDLVDNCRIEGTILIDGNDIYDRRVNVAQLRRRVGMVFQKPNPFPKSIYENVAYGLRVRGVRSKSELDGRVEQALKGAALWKEVKDRLNEVAFAMSGGQQQRLCIARALATEPELLLFDEPTSALDPIATGSIEDLIHEIRSQVSILIVTHNMQQAARVSDYTAYMYLGELVEFGKTDEIFIKPQKKETEDYITGRFG